MAFSKIKRLIGKKSNKGDATSNSPSSSPTRPADEFKPSTHIVAPPMPTAAAPAEAEGSEVPLLQTGSGTTGADDVLDGILQDLNIKVGQLALDVGKTTDTVSEFSGGSAKSVDSDESESSKENDDGETDGDDTEEDGEDPEDLDDPAKTGPSKRGRKSVGDRVAAVVAAAEEIRKKRGASPPAAASGTSSGRSTPATEPGPGARNTATALPPEDTAPVVVPTSSKTKGSKVSSLKEVLKKKPKSRSSTPQFSPEVTNSSRNLNNMDGNVAQSKSLDTRDDGDDNTKDTMDVSEDERTFNASKNEHDGDGTLDTFDDNTLETDGESSACFTGMRRRVLSGESTFTEEEDEEEEGRTKTKKTVMNKDIIIHQPGGPSNLVVRAMYYTPLPASPEDIIIKVEASTVSFRDCLLRCGVGVDKVPFPFVPGCEVVGHISNLGKAARGAGYRVGDRVVGLLRQGGGNGYYAKLSIRNAAPVPNSSVAAADVVCLVDVYMAAYQALRLGKKDGTPLTDANVLVTDGFSPLGQAAVTLAKAEGANVYVTTTESRQDEYMKTLGVKCLPLAPTKWLHKLKGKMDIVIDNTCFDSYDSSWKALNDRGVLVCTGMTSIYKFQEFAGQGGCTCEAFGDVRDYQAKWSALKARYMMSQTRFLDLWESFQSDPKKYQQELKYLCFLVESGALTPKIAERVSIEEVADAQRYLETGKANGCIVCLP